MDHSHHPERRSRPRTPGQDDSTALRERRPPRHRIHLPCDIILIGCDCHKAVLEDVSYRGFKLRCDAGILVGSKVELELPGFGRIPAQIRWALGGHAGGSFLAHLPHDLFDHLSGEDTAND